MSEPITPELLLQAYRAGIFPMAEDGAAEELFWFDPPERAIFPLDAFHVPVRLRRTLRRWPYQIRINDDFTGVMRACAAPNAERDRAKTWINAEIIALYTALHRQGHAHCLSAWHDGKCVGGLYGVQVGGAFCGESMFSTMTDASKICLVTLVALLRANGFQLLDCQFMTDHLAQFGAQTISRLAYKARLKQAAGLHCRFGLPDLGAGGVAMGGTYPGTGTGKLNAVSGLAGVATGGGDGTAIGAGVAAVTGTATVDAGLAALVTGFLQVITQTS